MNFLRRSFLWLLLLGSAVLWVYVDVTKKGACMVPIKYAVGTFDSRFNLSQTDFKKAIDESVDIWENSTGKNLFEYDTKTNPENPFYKYIGRYFVRRIPVNLVYDSRQAQSNQHRDLVSQVNEQKGVANDVKAEYTMLQNKYKIASTEYQTLLGEYRKRRASYEAVEAKRQEVNSLADQVNALIKKYNLLIGEVNQTVRTINQYAGQEFEEGQYVSDASGERITIYEFGTRADLVRVLAHEFGHALGLEHNENPESIMYYLNESSNIMPTEDDLAPLSAICKAK